MSDWAVQFQFKLGTRANTIGWMTPVGEALLALCGGARALSAKIEPSVPDMSFCDGGITIQISEEPRVCNWKADPEAHRFGTVARALRPSRAGPSLIHHYDRISASFQKPGCRVLIGKDKPPFPEQQTRERSPGRASHSYGPPMMLGVRALTLRHFR